MRILVATGASGGHIFPAVAFIEAVREAYPGSQVRMALPERRVNVDFPGIETVYLGMGGLRLRPFSALLKSLGRLITGSLNGARILLDFRPDVVVGFGSMPSVPVVFLAWFLRIKTVIHEQNVIPGKANKLLARFVDRIALSFEESREYLHSPSRTVVTGNPLRAGMERTERGKALAALGLSDGLFTVTVTGGSQGSSRINRAFIDAARSFPAPKRLQVIHICGPAEFAAVSRAYDGTGIKAVIVPFLNEMQLAYSVSDMVICRAGATTCAELAYYALPALIIPYPFAYGHQSANAAVLEKKGCAKVVRDQDLDAAVIGDFLGKCMNDAGFLGAMKAGFVPVKRDDAGRNLARVCREALR